MLDQSQIRQTFFLGAMAIDEWISSFVLIVEQRVCLTRNAMPHIILYNLCAHSV